MYSADHPKKKNMGGAKRSTFFPRSGSDFLELKPGSRFRPLAFATLNREGDSRQRSTDFSSGLVGRVGKSEGKP
jgi:hypothetical protein